MFLETRKKMSESHKGNKSHFWKGGISKEQFRARASMDYKFWHKMVLERDRWTCQKYGTKGGKIEVHHIQNFSEYPELRFAVSNGITLSEKAHKEFHKKYGMKNNTKEQLIEFLKS